MVSQRLDKLLDQMEKYNSLQDKAKEITEKAEKEMKSQAMIAEKLGLKFKSANKYLDENNKLVDYMGREISRVGEVVTNFNKRTSVLTKTIESLNKKGKSFEIFSADSLKTYKRLGGNTFEYLAEAISGTREEITILGQEGAKVRKFAYGFLPSGTFRALNKVSSVLQAIGSATRRGTRNSQNYSKQINILKKDLKGLTEGSIEYTNVAETIRELEADMAPSGLGGSDQFGRYKIAANSNYIVIGAIGDDDQGSNAGAAYVYDATNLSASPTRLAPSGLDANDEFGESIAVSDSYIAVGAQLDDDQGDNAGAVYVYDATNLSATPTKLAPSGLDASDFFGHKVEIMGSKLVVGAYLDDDQDTNAGAVYVYDLTNLSAAPTKLTASDGLASSYFGSTIALG